MKTLRHKSSEPSGAEKVIRILATGQSEVGSSSPPPRRADNLAAPLPPPGGALPSSQINPRSRRSRSPSRWLAISPHISGKCFKRDRYRRSLGVSSDRLNGNGGAKELAVATRELCSKVLPEILPCSCRINLARRSENSTHFYGVKRALSVTVRNAPQRLERDRSSRPEFSEPTAQQNVRRRRLSEATIEEVGSASLPSFTRADQLGSALSPPVGGAASAPHLPAFDALEYLPHNL